MLSISGLTATQKVVTWLFELDGTYFWSTKNVSFGGTDYLFRIRPESFSGITMRRSACESGVRAPNTTSFSTFYGASACGAGTAENAQIMMDAVKDSTLVVKLVINGALARTWNFVVKSCDYRVGDITLTCEDFLGVYLDGEYPATPLISDISPSFQGDSCVPVSFGTAFLPLELAIVGAEKAYILGDTGTYTISEVRSPKEWGSVGISNSQWTYPEYAMTQAVLGGVQSVKPIIAPSDINDLTTIDAMGWWPQNGAYLPMPCQYSDAATATTTNPADVIEAFLISCGVPSALIDSTSFTTAASTFTSQGITFEGGWTSKGPRQEVLASLLLQCNGTIEVRDKVYLRAQSNTAVYTLLTSDVLRTSEGKSTFNYSTAFPKYNDSGYVSISLADTPDDQRTTILVNAGGEANPDSQTIQMNMVHSAPIARGLAKVALNTILNVESKPSWEHKLTGLGLQPSDVVNITHNDYGALGGVLIDEIRFNRLGTLSISTLQFANGLVSYAPLGSEIIPTAFDHSGSWFLWSPEGVTEFLSDIVDDSKLVPVEKRSLLVVWQDITVQYDTFSAVDAIPADMITTYYDPYDTAYQALGTYLNNGDAWTVGTIPSWIGTDIAITTDLTNRTTLTGLFETFYTTRETLTLAIAAIGDGTAVIFSDDKLSLPELKSLRKEWDGLHDYIGDVVYNKTWVGVSTATVSAVLTAFEAVSTFLNEDTAWTWAVDNATVPSMIHQNSLDVDNQEYDLGVGGGAAALALWNTLYDAKTALDTAFTQVQDDVFSDGLLTPKEMYGARSVWNDIVSYNASVLANSALPSVSTTVTDAAVLALETLATLFHTGAWDYYTDGIGVIPYYLQTAVLDAAKAANTNYTIDGSVYRSAWNGWVEARQNLDAALIEAQKILSQSVVFIGSAGMDVVGNKAVKTSAVLSWGEQAYSDKGFIGPVAASAFAGTGSLSFMFGLDSSPLTDAGYLNLDYVVYTNSNGDVEIHESGSYKHTSTYGTWVEGDPLSVVFDGANIKYYHKGQLIYTSLAPPTHGNELYFDSSFYHEGASLTNMTLTTDIQRVVDNPYFQEPTVGATAAEAAVIEDSQATINRWADDGIFDITEKASARPGWDNVAAEYQIIIKAAYDTGVSYTTYLAAFDTYATYLNNGNAYDPGTITAGVAPLPPIPRWLGTDIGVDTTIDRATFRAAWATYAEAVKTIKVAINNALSVVGSTVRISGDQSFKFLAGQSTPVSSPIVLTATLTGPLTTYDWEYWTGFAWANLSGTQNAQTYSLAYNNAAWGTSTTLTVRCVSGAYSDEFTVVKLYDGDVGTDGKDAITVVLSNEAHTIPTDSAGNNGNYTGSGTTIRVYEGTTELSYTGSSVIPGQWSVSKSTSNITYGITTDSGSYATIGNASNMTANTAYINFTISGRRADNTAFSIVKTQTFSKSLAGTDGTTGKGISTIVEYYYLSSSNTTQTGGSWSTSPSTTTSSLPYLWNRELITYSDSSTEYTTPHIVATYAVGKDGRGITGITNYYAVSSNGSTAPVSGWSTAQQTTTPTNKYLWNYESITWSSGTSPTTTPKIVIGTHGDTGADSTVPGPQGNSLRRCYSHTTAFSNYSGTKVTSGSSSFPASTDFGTPYFSHNFTAAPPAMVSGDVLYQCDGVFDGTNTTWQAPYVSIFKVGSLSALSADLGTVTSGNIDSAGRVEVTGAGVNLSGGFPTNTFAIIGKPGSGSNTGGVCGVGIGGGMGVYGEGGTSGNGGYFTASGNSGLQAATSSSSYYGGIFSGPGIALYATTTNANDIAINTPDSISASNVGVTAAFLPMSSSTALSAGTVTRTSGPTVGTSGYAFYQGYFHQVVLNSGTYDAYDDLAIIEAATYKKDENGNPKHHDKGGYETDYDSLHDTLTNRRYIINDLRVQRIQELEGLKKPIQGILDKPEKYTDQEAWDAFIAVEPFDNEIEELKKLPEATEADYHLAVADNSDVKISSKHAVPVEYVKSLQGINLGAATFLTMGGVRQINRELTLIVNDLTTLIDNQSAVIDSLIKRIEKLEKP